MTDETRAELRQAIESMVRLVGVSHLRPGVIGGSTVAFLSASGRRISDFHGTAPLTTAQQLALSVLIGDESVLPQALADYLLDQGHEYATAVAERARVDGEKAGIEAEKARCLHLLGMGRTYFARGGAVSDMAADELRLAIEGNLKPTPKAFFRSSCLR